MNSNKSNMMHKKGAMTTVEQRKKTKSTVTAPGSSNGNQHQHPETFLSSPLSAPPTAAATTTTSASATATNDPTDNDRIIKVASSISPWGRGAQFKLTTIGNQHKNKPIFSMMSNMTHKSKNSNRTSSSASSSSGSSASSSLTPGSPLRPGGTTSPAGSTPSTPRSLSTSSQCSSQSESTTTPLSASSSSSLNSQHKSRSSINRTSSTVLKYLLNKHYRQHQHKKKPTHGERKYNNSNHPPSAPASNNSLNNTRASLSLSPSFSRICWIVVCTIVGLAATLSALAQHHNTFTMNMNDNTNDTPDNHHHHHGMTNMMHLNQPQEHEKNTQRQRQRQRQMLHEYMLENGVEEPLYIASTLEQFLLRQGPALGWNENTTVTTTTSSNAVPKGQTKTKTTKSASATTVVSNVSLASGCKIWTTPHEAIVRPDLYQHTNDNQDQDRTNETQSAMANKTPTTSSISMEQEMELMQDAMRRYRSELQHYQEAVEQFPGYRNQATNHDIRKELTQNEEADFNVCQKLNVPPIVDTRVQKSALQNNNDLQSNFFATSSSTKRKSKQQQPPRADHTLLSKTLNAGWMEPLLVPMRHVDFCFQKKGNYANINYLVHDFAHICRERLQPKSRVVLVDITGSRAQFATELKLVRLYRKFGIPVDDVLAFEIRNDDNSNNTLPEGGDVSKDKKQTSGKRTSTSNKKLLRSYKKSKSRQQENRHKDSFRLAPRQLQAAADLNLAYHFRTGSAETILDPTHPQNPLFILQQEYTANDLILVKIDIDIPDLELALVRDQILKQPKLWPLIDQLYFEHHVHMSEMSLAWKTSSLGGTILDSLQLFSDLRNKGIAAHFWV